MASIQELLAASQAQKSPFISLLEGAATGVGRAQENALERTMKLIQLDKMRSDMEAQKQMRKEMADSLESRTRQQFNQNLNPNEKPTVTPQQKLQWEYTQDSSGRISKKLKMPKPPDPVAQELAKARTAYYKERAGDVLEQQEERDYKRRERRNTERTRILDRFNADPSVKKSQQMIDGAKIIGGLATSDNPIAAGAIPTFMARASGEVGNLSEADKRPFGGSSAIHERLSASAKQAATGKLTESNKQFILSLADVMKNRARSNMNVLAQKRAKQYSRASDFLTQEQILTTLMPEMQEVEISDDKKSGAGQKSGVPVVGGSFNGEKVLKVERLPD